MTAIPDGLKTALDGLYNAARSGDPTRAQDFATEAGWKSRTDSARRLVGQVFKSGLRLRFTGPAFVTPAQDRAAIIKMKDELVGTAGNFYINDKPTGAVVGQQPFGGSRASGTNDKAGSYLNLIRWTSPRTVKETFDPPRDYLYPYMSAR